IVIAKKGDQGKDATLRFSFSLEDGGCPYPFLEAVAGTPLVISSEVMAIECDFEVTAVDPGHSLELTSVSETLPQSRHSIAIVVYDGYDQTRIHRIEQEDFGRDITEDLDSGMIYVHITNPAKTSDKDADVEFITFNSKPDDCLCPNSTVILDYPNSTFEFTMPKRHCFQINCTTTVQIEERLRHTYRMKTTGEYREEFDGSFRIVDGISEGLPLKYVSQSHDYISVHPLIDLVYAGASKPSDVSLHVSLVPISEELQAQCDCPPFYPGRIGATFLFTIPGSCPSFDCV
ncbi:hypothetical protein PFISCL1PPCAC_23403, partial [Pristionchus fissidentatus]